MNHAPVGDFGAELNHSLNKIGNHARDAGLTGAQLDALIHAGIAARHQLFFRKKPLAQTQAELLTKVSDWLRITKVSIPEAERILNAGVSASGNLPAALFARTA